MPTPMVGNRYELRRQLEQRDGVLSFEGWDTQTQRSVLVLLMRAGTNDSAEQQARLSQFARLEGLVGTTPDSTLPAILDSGNGPPDQNGETTYYLVADWVSGTPQGSRYPDITTFLAALQAALAGRQIPDRRLTPPTPSAAITPLSSNDEGRITVIRGEVPPIIVQNQPTAPSSRGGPDAPTQANLPVNPIYQLDTTSPSFGDVPSAASPVATAPGSNISNRQPAPHPVPGVVDPQTGQPRGEPYVAGKPQRVGGSLAAGRRGVYLVGAIIALALLLLLVLIFSNRNNQQAVTNPPAPTATTVVALLATPTAGLGNAPATATAPQAFSTATAAPIIAVPASPTAAGVAGATPCAVSLADLPPSDPDYGPLSAMICRQAFYPAPGGNFARSSPVTRAEIAHAVVAVMGWPLGTNAANPFRDVQPSTPYYADILTVIEHGVMSGVAADRFDPNANLSRIQAVRVIVKAAGWPLPDSNTAAHYRDVLSNNPLFTYVEAAYAHKVIAPTPGNLLRPNDPATRKDVALMLINMLNSK